MSDDHTRFEPYQPGRAWRFLTQPDHVWQAALVFIVLLVIIVPAVDWLGRFQAVRISVGLFCVIWICDWLSKQGDKHQQYLKRFTKSDSQ